MMSSKDLLVGADGQVLVVRFRKPSGIEYVAYIKASGDLLIRKVDGQLYTVEVTVSTTPLQILALLVESTNPIERLETLRKDGAVNGPVQYLRDDPFTGDWALLVQTAIEKSASVESLGSSAFVLEI
ncbi:hypothetical protein [Ralstonia pseudosolanacearum]|uniref:hypothetical protein n=1 Tax=Ralstonia pseudosolanacearum TaxID=1310165 RepID=UPI003CF90C85